MKIILKSIFKHTLVFASGSVAAKLIGFFLLPLYTRYLSPADYGILELLSVSMMIAGTVTLHGVPSGFIRSYCMEYKDDEQGQNEILTSSFIYLLFVSAVTYGLLIPFSGTLNNILFPEKNYSYLISLTCIQAFFENNVTIPQALLRSRLQSFRYVFISTTRLIANVFLNILFVVALHKGISGIIYGNLISAALAFVLFTAVIIKELKFSYSIKKLKGMISFGYPLAATALLGIVMTTADRFMIQHFWGSTDLGIYSIGYRISIVLRTVIINPFTTVWPSIYFPLVNDKDGLATIGKISTLMVLLFSCMSLLTILVSKPIIFLMTTRSFWDAYMVCPFIISATVLEGLAYLFSVGITIRNKMVVLVYITAITGALNIGLNYLLIPKMGIQGASVASFFSYLTSCTLIFIFSQRIFPIPFELNKILKIALFNALVLSVSISVFPDRLPYQFITILASAAVYIALLLLFRIVSMKELKKGLQFLPQIVFKEKNRQD